MKSQKAAPLHDNISMPLISISKAAKLFNVSRPTLQKALKDGAISGVKVKAGGSETWQIDTAELARSYTLRQAPPEKVYTGSMETPPSASMEKTYHSMQLPGEAYKGLESLTIELEQVRSALEQARADQLETQKELAAAQAVAEERKRLLDDVMQLLPPPAPAQPAQPPARQSWWRRRRS